MNRFASIVISLVAGLFASGCSTTSQEEYTTRWTADKPQFLELSNGLTVRYVKTGNGPPLVLLHTIRTQLDYFEKLAPQLKDQHAVYALDLPGHGHSSLTPAVYTEEFLRKAVVEFVTKLDLKNVTLVGESIGAVLALTVSTELPDRVKRVVSLNPYDYGDAFGGGVRRGQNGWMVGLFSLFGSYTLEPRFVTAAVLNGGFYDPSHLPDALLTEFSRAGSRDGYRRVEYSVFKNWTTWAQARQLYSRITVPVTLVYGSHDWSNVDERTRNQREIANATFITIDKAGHFLALEKPAEIAHIIAPKRAQ
jgi:pimeloyl-ACP methyl ester carboxylesterase